MRCDLTPRVVELNDPNIIFCHLLIEGVRREFEDVFAVEIKSTSDYFLAVEVQSMGNTQQHDKYNFNEN